jgi:hypothetical protein
MKKTEQKDCMIFFQEKTSQGFVDREFKLPKSHLEFHLQQMKKSPDVIKNIKYRSV